MSFKTKLIHDKNDSNTTWAFELYWSKKFTTLLVRVVVAIAVCVSVSSEDSPEMLEVVNSLVMMMA